MSEILKFFGIGLMLLSAVIFSKEYEKHLDMRQGIAEGFLSLLLHVRRQIDCYLTPASRLADGFSCAPLEKCGFLKEAKEKGVGPAYSSMKDSPLLYESAKAVLTPLFLNFGKEYKENTVKQIDGAVASLKDILQKEKEESERSLKVARTLAVSAALGAAILII